MNNKFSGIGSSNGISIAKVFKYVENDIKINNSKISNSNIEIQKIKDAIKLTIEKIQKIKENALKNLGFEKASIFDAHIQIANDIAIFNDIKKIIENEKYNVLYATNLVFKKYIKMFQSMEDPYMQERATDVKDVLNKIIHLLAGVEEVDLSSINEEVIIVAYDLTPSDTIQLNKKYVKGFLTNIGGKTSHAAILARSLEIPAILGLGNVTKLIKKNDLISMNGETGEIIINPSKKEINELKQKQKLIEEQKNENLNFKGKKTFTNDGHQVELAANIGSLNDLPQIIKNDAEAIGLLRSEFLYMDANDWPTEEEQYHSYSKVLKNMKNKKVIIRTLDIGGDKKLNYFNFPKELNPFLGYRAIRMSLDKKDIFNTQLKALLRASIHGNLAIMFPLIATINEFLEVKNEFEKAKKDLDKQKIKYSNNIEIGIMIEVPATALIAKQFAKYVDFFSIGTNDLMQYTMAADRMNENVSYLYQPLNPSILKLIKMTIEGAHSEGKWVGMCGEMASDQYAIPILIGMGLNEFSMSASSILSSRKLISKINFVKAKNLASQVLKCSTEKEVKKLITNFKL